MRLAKTGHAVTREAYPVNDILMATEMPKGGQPIHGSEAPSSC